MQYIARIAYRIFSPTTLDTSAKITTTHSKPADFPSTLRAKRSQVQTVDLAEEEQAVTQTPCEKCGHPEVTFTTAQLRSADEGSTVFFTCPKCNHKYVERFLLAFSVGLECE